MKETFNYLFRRIIYACFFGLLVFLVWNWFLVPTFGLIAIGWKFCALAGIISVLASDMWRGQYIISEVIKPWQLIIWSGVIFLACLLLK